jgi:GPH family glycoside/pentoside/hexuronide:cation symporter
MTESAEKAHLPNAKDSNVSPGRIPTGVKISYGAAEMSGSLLYELVAVYFLLFMTDVAGISPSIAGSILFVAVLWDAFSDPTMGIISDRTRSRFGRRRPYLIGVAVPFGVVTWLLFTLPPLEGYALIAYFILTAVLVYTSMTIADITFTALAPEMTRDYDERTSLVSYRVIWAIVGVLIGSATPLLIVEQFSNSNPRVGWSVAGGVLGFICIIPILITWRGTRGWERYRIDAEPLSLKDIYQAVVGNRTFRYLIGITFFARTASYAMGAAAIYFFLYVLHMSEIQISIWWVIVAFAAFIWVPLITFISNRIGKRAAFMIFVGFYGVMHTVAIMLLQSGQFVPMCVVGFLGALGGCAIFQLALAMIPDAVEVDEFKTGKRREGLYAGVSSFLLKLGTALSIFIVGQVLERVGYVPDAEQTPSVIMAIRLLYGPFFGALLLISAFLVIFFPMTRKRHKALLKAIKAKNAGEPWDEEEIRPLL